MNRLKEIGVMLLYMGGVLLFPWIVFLLVVRWLATLFEVEAASVLGIAMSALPSVMMFVLAYLFLKLDDWDFRSLGLNFGKILPGFIFSVLVMMGLYVMVPFLMTIFYEPRTLVVTLNPIDVPFIANFIRSWFIVGICEEFAARGYLLNKLYSVLPTDYKWIKKILSVILVGLFFMLVGLSRYKASGVPTLSNMSSIQVWLIFFYGCFMGYLYLVTHNIFVPAFMQSLLDFPPLGLTVGKEFYFTDFGFIFSMLSLFFLIIILAHTYIFWGKPLEFGANKAVSNMEPVPELNEPVHDEIPPTG